MKSYLIFPLKNILYISFAFLFLLAAEQLYAQDQKIGYFESDMILAQLPEYGGIEQRLQLLSSGWQEEAQELLDEITFLEEDYEAKQILYTDEIRKQKQDEITQKKKQRQTFLQQKFGPNGEYFQQQSDLLEPIQRKVFSAARTVAIEKGYDFIFDRSGDIYMIYARAEFDITTDILLELGIDIEN
ncbi:MAG: OmpH family outer membrane protein [Bacteroidetes bacterium]|nr:OmpH family outer membrane protein [Bacteroidota bacterium]